MWSRLPPVGEPILLGQNRDYAAVFSGYFQPYQYKTFASGTQALAAAMLAARVCKACDQPEVLLPAYGCPALVAAAIYAGLKPVLVDVQPDTLRFDLSALELCFTENTVAVVGVHLFGLKEDMAALRVFSDHHDVFLIEDAAQCQFVSGEQMVGDALVLSFGRGKPVSVLGGGMLLADEKVMNAVAQGLSSIHYKRAGEKQSALLRGVKVILYNKLLSRGWYGLVARLPFLKLGVTCYQPLEGALVSMPTDAQSLLPANLSAHQHASGEVQNQIHEMLAEVDDCHIIDVPHAYHHASSDFCLLRYPLRVTDKILRSFIFKALQSLGASTMYPAAMPAIDNVPEEVKGQGPFPNAEQWAEQLLTLPVHSGVSERDIARIKTGINKALRGKS